MTHGLQAFFLLITLSSCLGSSDNSAPTAQFSPLPEGNSGGVPPIRWPASYFEEGIRLQIADEEDISGLSPTQYVPIIESAMKAWDDIFPEQTIFQYSQPLIDNTTPSNLMDYRDNILGIYFADSWFTEAGNGALAITQFFGTRRNVGTNFEYIELNHSDIIFNTSLFDLVWNGSTESGYDIPSILLHELGHFLGLPHISGQGNSVMLPFLNQNTQYRNLFPPERSYISWLYEPVFGDNALLTIPVLAALSAEQSRSPAALAKGEGERVRGIIELTPEGECRHYLNGELVYSH